MADLDEMTPGEVLADASVAEFIRELGLGIAAAQTALDDNSVRQIDVFTERREDLGGRSLLDLGLSPAFYHYQHADITCSMQVRMEVGKSDEFGFGARFGFNENEDSSESDNSSETETQSGSRSETRRASMTMRADSAAALAVTGGDTITPNGTTPMERLADLRQQLANGNSGIDTLIARPPSTKPDMTLNAPTDKVVVNSPTVAFLRPDADNAVIRLRNNVATDYVVNGSLTVNTTAQADLGAYIAHVIAQFTAAGYAAVSHITPASSRIYVTRILYATGVSAIPPDQTIDLINLAGVLKATDFIAKIEGFTDRQGPQSRNVPLGEARARGVYDFLLAQGVSPSQLTFASPISRGETPAQEAGDRNGQDNQEWRTTHVSLTNMNDHLIIPASGPDFDPAEIAPSAIGNLGGGPDNAYIHLYDQQPLNLSGNGVTIDGTSFGFSGTANGAAAGTAEAHANNLTDAVNATSTHRAWAEGNVVRVARSGDTFDIQLFATTSREIQIAQSSDFTITEQFTRTSSRVQSRDRNQNRSIAVGVSVDGRFSRQFNQEVTGNSTISARLVSIPAPAEFLEQIRAYQNELDE